MKQEYLRLKEIGFEVIKEYNLPSVKDILFKASLSGTRKRDGSCIRYRKSNEYKICVNTTDARYVEDPNGKFVNKITKIKYRRLLIGKEKPFETICIVLSHEIAHLKFWNHNTEHLSFTKELTEVIKNKYTSRT
jgi:hypothetical protein